MLKLGAKVLDLALAGLSNALSRPVFLLLWLGAVPLHADDVFSHQQTAQQLLAGPLKQVATAMRGSPVLRGRFVYKKFLSDIPAPLVSKGEFLVARDQGIDWHTREPFDSEFILTPRGMLQRDQGRTTLRMNANDQPAVNIAARLFMSLLSLNMGELQNSFKLYGMSDERGWRVGLRPLAPGMEAVFKEALITGNEQVSSLMLRDANGDRAEVSFSAQQLSGALTAEEQKLFVMSAAEK